MPGSSLKGFERLGKRSRSLDPSGHRGVRVLDPHERDARAVRNDQFLWDLEAVRFRSDLDLLGRAHRLGLHNIVVAETETLQGRMRSVLVAPVALCATGRERVTRHAVALLQRALRLIMYRRAKIS